MHITACRYSPHNISTCVIARLPIPVLVSISLATAEACLFCGSRSVWRVQNFESACCVRHQAHWMQMAQAALEVLSSSLAVNAIPLLKW